MEEAGGFLSRSEFEEFSRPDRFFARQVLQGRGRGKQESLLQLCTNPLDRRNVPRFSAFAITVQPDDGMSWSAESVYQEVRRKRRGFKCVAMQRPPIGSPPAISALVPAAKLLRLAVRCKLADAFLPAVAYRALTLLVLAAVGVAAYAQVQKVPPGAWILAAIVGALAAIKVPLEKWLPQKRMQTSQEKFLATIATVEPKDGRRADLVNLLAEELRSVPFPRYVVVDDFEGLDALTHDVVLRYFERMADQSVGCGVWCIFDRHDGQSFSTRADIRDRQSAAFHGLIRATQLTLSAQEKAQLITVAGTSPDHKAF